jgi:crotonobetainyl-CoA:carnitine CoA-transferase CaiB-like acyl-CoA transferase
MTDERLANNAKRCDAREWMLPILEARLKALPLDDILQKCEAARIPYARVGRPDQLTDDAHLNAFGGLIQTAVSGMGGGPHVGIPALPVEFGDMRERPGLERQPPRIGEHTGEILREAGFDPKEIERLQASGVVKTA